MKRGIPLGVILMLALALPSAATAAEPALSWSGPQTVDPGGAIAGIDCPTTTFCGAADGSGNVVTSTNPSGSVANWSVAQVLGRSLADISCSSSALCVGVSDGNCPPEAFCAAVVEPGKLVASTNPSGGAAQWTETTVPGAGYLTAVDCTTGLCAALDMEGRILTSTDPAGGAGTWSVADLSGSSTPNLKAISCPSASLCVGVGNQMHSLGGGFSVRENVVFTSTNPTGGAGAWTKTYLSFNSAMAAISCPSSSFCIAVDKYGEGWTSSNPTGGASAWSKKLIDTNEHLTDVSCPTSSFCVALDESGHVLTSTNPTGGMEAWSNQTLGSVTTLSCPSITLCFAGGGHQIVAGTPPAPVEQGSAGGTAPPPPPPIAGGPLTLAALSQVPVRDGKVELPLSCQGVTSCSGGIKLFVPASLMAQAAGRRARPAQTKIGAAGFSLSPGTTRPVTIPLNKNGRKLFAVKKRVRAQLSINARASGQVILLHKTITLKAAPVLGSHHHAPTLKVLSRPAVADAGSRVTVSERILHANPRFRTPSKGAK